MNASEQPEAIEQSSSTPFVAIDAAANVRTSEVGERGSISPQTGCGCDDVAGASPDGAATPSFVYAIGRVEARFPNLAAEKEFAQATGRTDTAGKTDQQTFHTVLSKRENRYRLRQLCWVLTSKGWRPTC